MPLSAHRGYSSEPAECFGFDRHGPAYVGAGRSTRDAASFALGTVVSGGVPASEQPVEVALGYAGEAGSMVVSCDGRRCRCGGIRCLKADASGGGIGRGEELMTRTVDDGELRQATECRPISSRVVTEAAGAGDSATIAVLERVSAAVGAMIDVPDPDLVVIGGGVAGAGILLLNPAQRRGRQHVFPGARVQARLPRSSLGAGTEPCRAAAEILASADLPGRDVQK